MPVLTAQNLTDLRTGPHRTELYASILKPLTLWSAVVNDAGISRAQVSIPFASGTGLDFSAVEVNQTVWIGTSAGARDIGTARIKAIASGNGGVSGTLTVSIYPYIIPNGAHLTFKHNYELWALRSYIDPATEIFYKDRDIAYTDQNTKPNPVAILGPHRAGFLASGQVVFNLDASASYAIADGATITSYALSVYPAAGTTINFNTSTGLGTITMTSATQPYYWVKLTVTDSNSKTQSTYRCFFVHSPTPGHALYPFTHFQMNQLNAAWSRGGWYAQLMVVDEATATAIPDNTLFILHTRNYYAGTLKNVSFLPQGNTALVGYARRQNITQQSSQGHGNVFFSITTVDDVLRNLYAFSISLEAFQGLPDTWWKYEEWMTVGRVAHHVMKWHSTLLEVADVRGLTADTLRRAYAELEDGSLYDIIDGITFLRGIRRHLVSNKAGQLSLVQDIQLLGNGARAALPTVQTIERSDRAGEFQLQENSEPELGLVYVSGIFWNGTTFNADGNPEVDPFCAIGPGVVPGRFGAQATNMDFQTISGQAHANELAGRVYAQGANPYPEIRLTFAGNYLGVLDIDLEEWWEIDVGLTDTIRQVVLPDQHMALRQVSAEFKEGGWQIQAIFELEADGYNGIPTDCLGPISDLGGEEVEIGPESLPGALITASSAYYLSPGTSNWVLRTTDAINHIGQDPFWRTRQNTTASDKAIIFSCEAGRIRRSTKAGSGWTLVTPSGAPPNDAGDSPAPTMAQLNFIQHIPSKTQQGRHAFLARWLSGGGNWRSWLFKTDDDGATYSSVQVSAGGGGPATFTKLNETLITDDNNATNRQSGPTAVMLTTGRGIYTNANLFGGVGFTMDGAGVFTVNTSYTRWDTAAGNSFANHDHDAVRLTDTRGLMVYCRGLTAARVPFAVSVDYSGGATITPNTPFQIHATTQAHQISVDRRSDTRAVVCWAQVTTGGAGNLRIAELNIDAGTGAVTVVNGPTTVGGPGSGPYTNVGCQVIDNGDRFVITWTRWDNVATYRSYGVVVNITPTWTINTITELWGDAVDDVSAVETRGPGKVLVSLDTNKLVHSFAVFDNTLFQQDATYAQVLSISGATITPGPRAVVTPQGASAWRMAHVGGENVVTTFLGGDGLYTQSFSVSGTTVTDDNNLTKISTQTGMSSYPCLTGTANRFVVGAAWQNTTPSLSKMRLISVDLVPGGAGGPYKASGAYYDGGGASIWVTGTNDTDLSLLRYDNTLTQTALHAMGAGTISQFDARTRWLFPFSPDDSAGLVCYVFGRMAAPQGLSNPSHVIATTDGGSSWSVIEDTWGTDFCGALYAYPADIFPTGELLALRNQPNLTKLYGGVFVLDVLSTLSFLANVNPLAMAVDRFDDTVIACADTGNALMVLVAPWPHDEWFDLTSNHGIAAGIKSVEIL